MYWEVTDAKVVGDHKLWVRFKDGTEGPVRFLPGFFRGVFTPLLDQAEFEKVAVTDGAVTWPADLDLEVKGRGEWVLDGRNYDDEKDRPVRQPEVLTEEIPPLEVKRMR